KALFVAPDAAFVEIRLAPAADATEPTGPRAEIVVERPDFAAVHRAGKQGGYPEKIVVKPSGKTIECHWNDRLYDRAAQTIYALADDADATIELVSDGPLATVVRARAGFVAPDGRRADSDAATVVDWIYWKPAPNGARAGLPAEIGVEAAWSKRGPRVWDERHFLEFRLQGQFTQFFGDSDAPAPLEGGRRNFRYARRAAVLDPENGVGALFSGGSVAVHDGNGLGESYLHAEADFAWTPWTAEKDRRAAVVSFGTAAKILADAAASPAAGRLDVGARLETPGEIYAKNWREAARARLKIAPDDADAIFWEGARLGAVLRKITGANGEGLALAALVDKETNRVVSAPGDAPLFELQSKTADGELVAAASLDPVWRLERDAAHTDAAPRFSFQSPAQGPRVVVALDGSDGGGLALRATVFAGTAATPTLLTTARVRLDGACEKPRFLRPRHSGIAMRRPFDARFNFRDAYPNGMGAASQWTAFWSDADKRGVYCGCHDPDGWMKTISLQGDPNERAIEIAFEIPVPREAESAFPPVVVEPFAGDWFDAAQIYKRWVPNAVWYPAETLSDDGRTDSPLWFKSLPVWGLYHHDGEFEKLRKFQEAFDVPVGIHWYCWHENPFDNDYPHYFPTRPGFKETVLDLQKSGKIHIMPYINGRLWDTRDRGAEDWRFTSDALPSATKTPDGEPYIEIYGSKESDGSPVKLAVMCPTTPVWRDKVLENVLRLTNEQGVDGVYIDQIAAAAPVACMDADHGHPLNGGRWWVPAYLDLMKRVRGELRGESELYPRAPEIADAMKARGNRNDERILTTECNSECYMKAFDGYLSWDWQNAEAVPAFAAVYGGAIQIFGRRYAGDEADAWRAKAAEALVFGEQLGWFGVDVVDRPDVFAYVRPLVRFRAAIGEYIWRGEMARPPVLLDEIPEITSDWNWYGSRPVATPAVRAGAWKLRDGSAALLIFTNSTTEPARSRVAVSLDELGFGDAAVLRRVDSEGRRSEPLAPGIFDEPFDFPAGETWGIEISRK
ncbi:MAG: hypothetical protein HUK22_02420, partial [Thermoguttaceae bacterium]|nr:hypothetical protein [Thermoguttaceae bacterium]